MLHITTVSWDCNIYFLHEFAADGTARQAATKTI
jgi:hypothetical protein